MFFKNTLFFNDPDSKLKIKLFSIIFKKLKIYHLLPKKPSRDEEGGLNLQTIQAKH